MFVLSATATLVEFALLKNAAAVSFLACWLASAVAVAKTKPAALPSPLLYLTPIDPPAAVAVTVILFTSLPL